MGPKTPKCCNPKPLAVTKTCLQVESFRCRLFVLFYLGVCLFARSVPKDFLCIFSEPGSGGRRSIWDVGPKPPVPQLVHPVWLEAIKEQPLSLGSHLFPAFQLNMEPGTVRWASRALTLLSLWGSGGQSGFLHFRLWLTQVVPEVKPRQAPFPPLSILLWYSLC